MNEPPQAPLKMEVGEFLQRMLTAEPQLRGKIDAVGIHPYGLTASGVLHASSTTAGH